MKNTLKKSDQLSFDDLLGDDITFVNKDENTKGSFNEREELLEHDEECDCLKCERKDLMK